MTFDFLQELINRYASLFGFQTDAVALALEELRIHAVAKLSARKRFTETGVATLNVRLSGQIPENANRNIQIEFSLKTNASSLKERLVFAIYSVLSQNYMLILLTINVLWNLNENQEHDLYHCHCRTSFGGQIGVLVVNSLLFLFRRE